MEPRIDGKLKSWTEDKGFGFITPLNGGQDNLLPLLGAGSSQLRYQGLELVGGI